MDTQLLIDNEHHAAVGGATFERVHPTTGSTVTRAAAGTVEDAIRAVESASVAFKTWRHSTPTERRQILLKAADALEARTPDFIEAMASMKSGPPRCGPDSMSCWRPICFAKPQA